MTADPAGIDEDLTLADAIDRMLANNVRHLLVLRADELIGVVDSADLALANAITQERTADVPVRSAMRGVFRCPPDMAVTDVVRTMERNHFTCAAVVDARHNVVGIFTIADALHALRQLVLGGAEPADARPALSSDDVPSNEAPPRVRVARMLRSSHAAPSADQGMAFGTVGL